MKLKVLRNELAKEFELIKVSKDGDVGYNLPAVLPYKDNWEELYCEYIEECAENEEVPDKTYLNELIHGYVTIKPGHRQLIPTGIHVELPYGYWASIEARSSTSKMSLIVPKGVIDEGYRGELFAQILNVGTEPVTIHHGDMLVQMIIHKNYARDFEVVEVDKLSESERGADGFGSTGQSAIK